MGITTNSSLPKRATESDAHRRLQAACHGHQQGVAGSEPVGVVERLEAVESLNSSAPCRPVSAPGFDARSATAGAAPHPVQSRRQGIRPRPSWVVDESRGTGVDIGSGRGAGPPATAALGRHPAERQLAARAAGLPPLSASATRPASADGRARSCSRQAARRSARRARRLPPAERPAVAPRAGRGCGSRRARPG